MDCRTVERVRKGLKNPSIGPETIALMLTERCNLRCQYCRGGRGGDQPQPGTDISRELTTGELFELFDEARSLSVKEINLGGMNGEPFCKKGVLEIMRKIKGCGFSGSVTTNGSFLSADIARTITGYKWDIMLLSLDSCDESIQHKLRPALNKEPYFVNITEFLDELNKINSGVRVLLNVVINKLNYQFFPELVGYAERYKNIQSVNVLRMLEGGIISPGDLRLDKKQLDEFRNILLGINSKKVIYQDYFLNNHSIDQADVSPRQDSSGLRSGENENRCFTNYYILSVAANGDVIQCPQYPVSVQGLNVRTTSLTDLWTNGHLKFRQKLARCARCFEGCCTILQEQNKLIYRKINNGNTDN